MVLMVPGPSEYAGSSPSRGFTGTKLSSLSQESMHWDYLKELKSEPFLQARAVVQQSCLKPSCVPSSCERSKLGVVQQSCLEVFVGNDFQDDDWATRALQSVGVLRPPRSRL